VTDPRATPQNRLQFGHFKIGSFLIDSSSSALEALSVARPSALTVNPFDHFDGDAIFLDSIEVALRGLADT
jgi:hypothetical protein